MLRAIPTPYNGVTYRSGLEADWALNLHQLRIVSEYEPEGFVLPSGSYYRPDLNLPRISTVMEVKGDHNQRIDKPHQLAAVTVHAPGCSDDDPVAVNPAGQDRGCACQFTAHYPWKLVIIGRAAVNGRMVVHPAGHPDHPKPNLVLARCAVCEQYTFADLTAPWCCRRCHAMGAVSVHRFADVKFDQLDHTPRRQAGRRAKKRRAAART